MTSPNTTTRTSTIRTAQAVVPMTGLANINGEATDDRHSRPIEIVSLNLATTQPR